MNSNFLLQKKIVLPILAVAYVVALLQLDFWKKGAFYGDSWGYYAHLPATFLYDDAGDYSRTHEATKKYAPDLADPRADKYGIKPTPTGKWANKYPLGVPILEAPFFAAAHLVASLSGGQWAADGFSRPYFLAISLATIFYVVVGLGFLWSVLARFFSPPTVAAVVVAVALATNLYHFSVYLSVMSHGYLFFLHAFLLWATVRFWESLSVWRAVAVGFGLGFIAITRSQEVIVGIVPLLWGVGSWVGFRERLAFFFKNFRLAAVALAAFAVALLPQLFYWKMVSGQWIYYAYAGETFDFRHPHLSDGLFGFKNGWLVYTPIMVFALAGFFLLKKWVRGAVLPIGIFLATHLFITYSWWCWTYINGFGARPMVDIYAWLALPLAVFWQWGGQFSLKKWANWAALAFFAWLNIFQTLQIKEGILWSEADNKAHYREIFGTLRPGRGAVTAWESGVLQPDPADLEKLTVLAQNGFEDSTKNRVTEPVLKGKQAARPMDEFENLAEIQLPADARRSDWLRVSVNAFVKGNEKIWNRDRMAHLIVEFRDAAGKNYHSRGCRISSKIGNPENSIWSTGDTDQWGEAVFFAKIPRNFRPDGKVMVYVWNPDRQPIFLDEAAVELWRKK